MLRTRIAITVLAAMVMPVLGLTQAQPSNESVNIQNVVTQTGNVTYNTLQDAHSSIYDAEDFAGDILLDGNQKAVKSTVTAFNAVSRLLKMPGDAVFDAIDGVNDPLTPQTMRQPVPFGSPNPNDPIVMMAVSGGGSRMAYFHASVLEQLAKIPDPWGKKRSLLDCIDVMSGVSGGCWSSAYYCANFEKRYEPDFFDKFKDAMSSNLEFRGISRVLLYPPSTARLLTSSRNRTDVLAKVMARTLGDGNRKLTFNDLQQKWIEAPVGNKPPVFIANGTTLNNGQRLVMTYLAPSQMPIAMDNETLKLYSIGRREPVANSALKPMHFEDFGSDIGTFRVGDAIAASAAYPLFLPPYNLKVYRDRVPQTGVYAIDSETLRSPWLQISDGGLYSNDGLDVLYSLVRKMPASRPVLIFFVYSNDLDIKYTGRDRTWWIVSIMSRMFTMSNSHQRVSQHLNIYNFHKNNKTAIVPIELHGFNSKQDDKVMGIPTAFHITYFNKKLISRVTPQIIQMMTPLWQDAPALFAGKMSIEAYMAHYNAINEHIALIRAPQN